MFKNFSWSRLFVILITLGMIFASLHLSGCTKGCSKKLKHTKSKWVGLRRKITLYGYDRELMKSWEGRFYIETDGAAVSFIDSNNKETKICGGIVLIEEQ